MKINLLDLTKQYNNIKKQIEEVTLAVLEKGQYILGENVKSFEKEVAEFTNTKYGIGVANGTDALVIALKSLGIGEGNEVITTSYTFFATAESISSVGAIPVFVDVDKYTFNIDISKIEEKITSKTKAIMPVHIFGQSVDMDKVMDIAEKYKLKVIEDACQAIGAEYKDRRIGSIGHISCFSFFPTKNLGCYGDGGMIVTNDENLATICKAIRAHGSGENGKKAYNILNNITEKSKDNDIGDNTIYNPSKYYNYLIGHNSRLDEIQAAMLRVKLKYLEEWNNKRNYLANRYNEKLKDLPIVMPKEIDNIRHVYHLYILQSEERKELTEFLEENGIRVGIYYPVPLHIQEVYKNLGYNKGDLPISEYLSERTFAIPLYPELTEEEQDYIIDKIREFYEYR